MSTQPPANLLHAWVSRRKAHHLAAGHLGPVGHDSYVGDGSCATPSVQMLTSSYYESIMVFQDQKRLKNYGQHNGFDYVGQVSR
jgi:hypothetical protein